MTLPSLVQVSDYNASEYIDKIYEIFVNEVVNGNLSFLGLPISCPWHPPYDSKHFSFWHLISESSDSNRVEQDRVPDMRRCERIKWIAYVINNASNKQLVWCWEKDIKTSRGKSKHIHLYFHEERYMVILRRKNVRFEIVTTFTVENHKRREEESKIWSDPR